MLLIFVAQLLTSCGGALDPQGPQAGRIATIWWVMLAMSVAIFTLVLGLLLYALLHPRRSTTPSTDDHALFIVGGGVFMPLAVLSVLMGLSVWGLRGLTNEPAPGQLQVNVVGHDWWWEVNYPDLGVHTANEIHIPAGRDVQVTGTSADVIHSFWAPQINGKMDLLPGKINTLRLKADQPGRYRGQCAEFCGLSHANMAFWLVVDPPGDFDAWVSSQQVPTAATALDARAAAGQRVFFANSCAACHGIRGTDAHGDTGPDLTHLSSRETIAGGTMQLNRANLYDWIAGPSRLKPGVQMPGTSLPASQMDDLIAYLMSLR